MAKRVGVVRLKAALSTYFAQVRAGEEIIVTERGRPIAKIVPLAREATAGLAEPARAGLVRVGSGRLPHGFWRMPRPSATQGAGVKAIVAERRGAR